MLGMWSMFAAAWGITFGSVTNDLVSYVGTVMVGTAVWGFIIIRHGRQRNGTGRVRLDGNELPAVDTTTNGLQRTLRAPRELAQALVLLPTIAGRWATAAQGR
jgi:hypothetical protein